MISWFDTMQERLADAIDPSTNTVGHFIKQIYAAPGFASGGSVNDTLNSDHELTDMSVLKNIANQAKASTTTADASVSGGKFGDTALGSAFYNSPAYIMQHYSQLGKFFSGAESGNKYTDHYAVPQKTQAPVSEDPNDFYARFYNKMRQFAQAEEITGAGQAEVRTR